ncbi:NUDIX domain-containing protein [Rhizobium sp. Leaf371]|uniref:NUDIX domain-containing protein n=1 Tax=Rhizobium sp. Leaf371 TaxID=1736355 RepID=UPI000A702E49|nr:NUDIX domain-containing protein [Rhizobium sp. Leaf371]
MRSNAAAAGGAFGTVPKPIREPTKAPLGRPVDGPAKALRPRLAASILLLDRSESDVRVLVGRRSKQHVFMPDVHVFPGGRRDPGDHRIAFARDLPAPLLDRLVGIYRGRLSVSAVRALALAALRELHEETNLAVGPSWTDSDRPAGCLPFRPDLERLRYVARALTPPGHVRRFDTHFFALFTDEVDLDLAVLQDSRELEDFRWVPVGDPTEVAIPDITARILHAVHTRLDADPLLGFDGTVPYFHVRNGRPIRDLL